MQGSFSGGGQFDTLDRRHESSPAYDKDGHLIGEYDGSGNAIRETIWLADTPVAVLKPNGGSTDFFYIHTDHLDTPRLVANSSGQAVWQWDFTDPFGASAPNENPSGLGTFTFNLRFPGLEFPRFPGHF